MQSRKVFWSSLGPPRFIQHISLLIPIHTHRHHVTLCNSPHESQHFGVRCASPEACPGDAVFLIMNRVGRVASSSHRPLVTWGCVDVVTAVRSECDEVAVAVAVLGSPRCAHHCRRCGVGCQSSRRGTRPWVMSHRIHHTMYGVLKNPWVVLSKNPGGGFSPLFYNKHI